MKKVLIGMVFILGLQGVQPVHAMSLSSAGYEVAKQSLEAAKGRVMRALSTNERGSIIAAVAALLVALSLFVKAKKSGEHAPLKLDSEEEYISPGKQSLVNDSQLLKAGIRRGNGGAPSSSTSSPSPRKQSSVPSVPGRYSGYYYYSRH